MSTTTMTTTTTRKNNNKTVVIFGATGAVGTALAERLVLEQPQWNIRAVSRKVDKDKPSRLEQLGLPNVTMVAGNPFDKEQVCQLSQDADIIVSCIGFHKYQAKYWAKHWPFVIDNLLAATVQKQGTKKDRRLVFCDNLYAYGAGHEVALSPHTTSTVPPGSRSKPAIRSQLRTKLQTHMKQYPGTVAVVGGADFFGPHVTATSFLGDTMTGKIVNGDSPLAIGSATVVHDFCYVKDFAQALSVACVNDGALDHFWICPHTIHNKTMTEIAQDIAAKVNKDSSSPPVKVSVLPTFLVYLLSPFMDFMWEMIEMLPFWTKDYKVDDTDFIQTFGIKATPYHQALDETVAFYQQAKEKE